MSSPVNRSNRKHSNNHILHLVTYCRINMLRNIYFNIKRNDKSRQSVVYVFRSIIFDKGLISMVSHRGIVDNWLRLLWGFILQIKCASLFHVTVAQDFVIYTYQCYLASKLSWYLCSPKWVVCYEITEIWHMYNMYVCKPRKCWFSELNTSRQNRFDSILALIENTGNA